MEPLKEAIRIGIEVVWKVFLKIRFRSLESIRFC